MLVMASNGNSNNNERNDSKNNKNNNKDNSSNDDNSGNRSDNGSVDGVLSTTMGVHILMITWKKTPIIIASSWTDVPVYSSLLGLFKRISIQIYSLMFISYSFIFEPTLVNHREGNDSQPS